MPKIIIHAPAAALDADTRRAIAAELTEFCLDCERLPKSPFMKSTVWTYFNSYPFDAVFMGAELATTQVASVEIFVIAGGLDPAAKKQMITGVTDIIGRYLNVADRIPVYIVIHEISEANWGIFGHSPDLAAMRASPLEAPAI